MVKFTEEELKELYVLLEELDKLFRDPNKYSNAEKVAEFREKNYHLIKKNYDYIFNNKIGRQEGVYDIINE